MGTSAPHNTLCIVPHRHSNMCGCGTTKRSWGRAYQDNGVHVVLRRREGVVVLHGHGAVAVHHARPCYAMRHR